jgi:hypothetical protein
MKQVIAYRKCEGQSWRPVRPTTKKSAAELIARLERLGWQYRINNKK